MKAVLISIRPQWCELIANGQKTIEVRKTRPKIDTPFKCYIYCTMPKSERDWGLCKDEDMIGLAAKCNHEAALRMDIDILSGKVIGEFVCNKITDLRDMGGEEFFSSSCMSYEDWRNYTDYTNHVIWGWHISDLVIYDNPKELSEFVKYGYDDALTDWEDLHCIGVNGIGCSVEYPSMPKEDDYKLTRPPQSWCYVEELK